MIYQPSCQGVTIVLPSPSVGGTPCRLPTSVKFVKSEENEANILTKNTTNVIFSNHQKKLVWDKANVESELIQELDQSENQQEGC